MITNATYIPVSEVIGDVSERLNDPELRKWTPASYESSAQRALSNLCHDADFDERHWECEIPSTGIIKLPFGMHRKSLVMAFNGDHCDMLSAQKVFEKPNYFHKGGEGAVANNLGSGEDLVPSWRPNSIGVQGVVGDILFYGESNGCLYLSPACMGFQKIHITYYGIGIDKWGCDFNIPEWARDAIGAFMTEKGAAALWMLTRDTAYRDIKNEFKLELALTNPNGAWMTALRRWSRMDKKQRTDTWTYTSWFGIPPY